MLNRWLRTPNVRLRFGVALARLNAAGLRLRTSGRAARTKGRIWSRTIEQVEAEPHVGAFGPARVIIAWLAVGSACAAGSKLVAAGPSTRANVVTLTSVAVVSVRVAGR